MGIILDGGNKWKTFTTESCIEKLKQLLVLDELQNEKAIYLNHLCRAITSMQAGGLLGQETFWLLYLVNHFAISAELLW